MQQSLIAFFLLLSFALAGQEFFQIPRDAEGRIIASEKFEMIHEYYKHLYSKTEKVNQEVNPSLSLRGAGEQILSDDREIEFEIHAIVNPANPDNIIAGAMNFDLSDTERPLEFPMYVTFDFGETWEQSSFNGIEEGSLVIGGGDPMFAFDESGRLHYSWLTINVDEVTFTGKWRLNTATSDDGGLTWDESYAPLQEDAFNDVLFLSDLTKLSDKQWVASDLSVSSPHYGNVYMAFVEIAIVGQSATYDINVIRKVAGEDIFQPQRFTVSAPNTVLSQYSSIDVDNDGTVYVSWMSNVDNTTPNIQEIYFSKSTDGGVSFSPAQRITELSFPDLGTLGTNIVGVDQNRLYPCPHIAVDKSGSSSDGTLYMAYTARGINSQMTTGFDIYLTRSSDGGDSWSTPAPVNDTSDPNTNQFYSSIEVNDEGIVALGWYDTRSDVNRTQTHYYIGYSEDSGQSFEEIQVSSADSNFSRIDDANNGIGIGEYNEILMVDDYIIPFWADGRTSDGNIAVYANFYKIGSLSVEDKSGPINKSLVIDGPLKNPTLDVVSFELTTSIETEFEFCIYDSMGQLISSRKEKVLGKSIRVEQSVELLESGTYLASFSSLEGVWTRKFVVE